MDEDGKAVLEWAKSHKITEDCVKIMWRDGFTSMEAMVLLEKEDIGSKIPRGQHRLILSAVRDLRNPERQCTAPKDTTSTENTSSDDKIPPGLEQDPYMKAVLAQMQSDQNLQQTGKATAACETNASPANVSWSDP